MLMWQVRININFALEAGGVARMHLSMTILRENGMLNDFDVPCINGFELVHAAAALVGADQEADYAKEIVRAWVDVVYERVRAEYATHHLNFEPFEVGA